MDELRCILKWRILAVMPMIFFLGISLGTFPRAACAVQVEGDVTKDNVPAGILTLCDNPFRLEGLEAEEHVGDSSNSLETYGCQIACDSSEHSEGAHYDDEEAAGYINQGIDEPTGEKNEKIDTSKHTDGELEEIELLATIRSGIALQDVQSIISKEDGFCLLDDSNELTNNGFIRLSTNNYRNLEAAISHLKNLGYFDEVQPNFIYKTSDISVASTVNDPYSKYQWELDSVYASTAWDVVKTSGAVSVAIIDTGCDLDHPDLAPNIVATFNALSNGNTVEDQIGHGTHVAGIVSGVSGNGKGISGVSYNANLVVIKAAPFKSNTFDTAAILRAYSWLESLDSSGLTVAEHYNVKVVNLSVGGLDKAHLTVMTDNLLIKAIQQARDEYGILTVCAAGNGVGMPFPAYPGDSDACISVMNLKSETDSTNETNGVSLHITSNFNYEGDSSKDICAPGTSIRSTWLEGGYSVSTGTSMAAPMVSGIAALLFAVNPKLTPQGCMGILEASAIDLGIAGWDERYGYGEVNALRAVNMTNAAYIGGWDVVEINNSVPLSAYLGWDMQETSDGWSWNVKSGASNAYIDDDGLLTGKIEGSVTVVATCTATTGAVISAEKTVDVINAMIIGDGVVNAGGVSSVYSTDDSRWTWVWKVEADTGLAHIDQDAILHADRVGVVYVTATCTSNTNIVLRKKVIIEA